MTVAERLQAMEQLWDSLSQEPENVPSPEWHRDILLERKKQAESGEAKFLTLAQLRSRLMPSKS